MVFIIIGCGFAHAGSDDQRLDIYWVDVEGGAATRAMRLTNWSDDAVGARGGASDDETRWRPTDLAVLMGIRDILTNS